jgi:hypothetical protein
MCHWFFLNHVPLVFVKQNGIHHPFILGQRTAYRPLSTRLIPTASYYYCIKEQYPICIYIYIYNYISISILYFQSPLAFYLGVQNIHVGIHGHIPLAYTIISLFKLLNQQITSFNNMHSVVHIRVLKIIH